MLDSDSGIVIDPGFILDLESSPNQNDRNCTLLSLALQHHSFQDFIFQNAGHFLQHEANNIGYL